MRAYRHVIALARLNLVLAPSSTEICLEKDASTIDHILAVAHSNLKSESSSYIYFPHIYKNDIKLF